MRRVTESEQPALYADYFGAWFGGISGDAN
jgi:hypothetical protein